MIVCGKLQDRATVALDDVVIALGLPLRMTCPLRIDRWSPGSPTTRLMKVCDDGCFQGTAHAAGRILPADVLSLVRIRAAVVVVLRRVEDDDVADVRRGEVHADPVHEHALVDVDVGSIDPLGIR